MDGWVLVFETTSARLVTISIKLRLHEQSKQLLTKSEIHIFPHSDIPPPNPPPSYRSIVGQEHLFG